MINDGCNHYGDIDIGSNSDRQGADQEFRKRAAGAGYLLGTIPSHIHFHAYILFFFSL